MIVDDLIARLTAAIEQRERTARSAMNASAANRMLVAGTPWIASGSVLLALQPDGVHDEIASVEDYQLDPVLEHAALNGPDEVLRGCAEDREIVYEYVKARDAYKQAKDESEVVSQRRADTATVFLVYQAVLKRVARRYGLEVTSG